MSYCIEDFDPPPMIGNFVSVQTADGVLDITGFGLVHWNVASTSGETHTITVPAHYMENGHRMRLFSPQDYSRYHKLPQESDSYGGNAIGCHLKIAGTDSVVICHVDGQTRVPLLLATNRGKHSYKTSSCSCKQAQSALSPSNTNLTKTQKSFYWIINVSGTTTCKVSNIYIAPLKVKATLLPA